MNFPWRRRADPVVPLEIFGWLKPIIADFLFEFYDAACSRTSSRLHNPKTEKISIENFRLNLKIMLMKSASMSKQAS